MFITAFVSLFPPLIFVAIQEKLKKSGRFSSRFRELAEEYLFGFLLLNLISIIFVSILSHFTDGLNDIFSLILSVFFAVLIPYVQSIMPHPTFLSRVRLTYWSRFIPVIASLIFFCLNIPRIFDNSFWFDECFTIQIIKMGVGGMLKETAADVHPPLYYLWVQLLYHFGGNNGILYHLTSLIPYGLLLLLSCTVVRKYFGSIAAMAVIVMNSFMQNAVNYNVEVRMYSLAAFFVLFSYCQLYGILTTGKKIHWALFTLASIAAAYTHYYALISVAFFYLVLWYRMIFRKVQMTGTLIVSGITVLAYLPWLGVLLSTFTRAVDTWWSTTIPSIRDGFLFLFDYPWICFTAFILVLLYLAYQIRILPTSKNQTCCSVDKEHSNTPILNLWILAGILSVLGTFAVGLMVSYLVRPLFLVRYLYAVSPVAYLILGICISKLRLKRSVAVLFILSILWSNLPLFLQTCKNERAFNQQTEVFLENVQPSPEMHLYSNEPYWVWNISGYYYPNNPWLLVDSLNTVLEQDFETGFLYWNAPLSHEESVLLDQSGFSVKEIYEGTFPQVKYLYVYEISKGVLFP